MNQGPDLSRLGSKLGARAQSERSEWLYTWLQNPSAYHPRTLMPNMILDPVKGTDGKTDRSGRRHRRLPAGEQGLGAEERSGAAI